jgi:heterodisulfide reductase subunit A
MPENHDLPEEEIAQNSSSGEEITQDSPPEEEIRVGVYTCHCGGNISDVVNCPAVADVLGKINNVIVSRTDMSMCSDAGQSLIEKDIKEKGIMKTAVHNILEVLACL